ncbi:MAG: hypothetical protein Q6365_007780 [Candidatus Sigynarchaeota archaeon]
MFPHLWQDPNAQVVFHQNIDGIKPGMKLPWDEEDSSNHVPRLTRRV